MAVVFGLIVVRIVMHQRLQLTCNLLASHFTGQVDTLVTTYLAKRGGYLVGRKHNRPIASSFQRE